MTLSVNSPDELASVSKTVMACRLLALLSYPIVWWRKPYGGLDGHGASFKGKCEGSPESIEVSSPGKLRRNFVSKQPIGSLEISSITA
jgi:hypothetical protein